MFLNPLPLLLLLCVCSVKELSHRMSLMDLHPMYSHNIYTHFVYSFLRHHNSSGEWAAVAVHVLYNHLQECVACEEAFESCSSEISNARSLCARVVVAEPQCVSSATSSSQWLKENFGLFSRFASVLDFYELNRNFSGVSEEQPLDSDTLTPTPISPPTSSPLASSAAGGSSSPDAQAAGRDAAAASSHSARETRGHRLGDGLPAGVPRGWEADASPA